ncbi:SAF domain-containing protein [Desulfofundulus salinus]|uniref:SAF domain-containing protein n=1 Tax=Desulfofundulus salinus TaxID=2419843 RepID=A0A494WVW7_9FIRM|nr:SAF domain-containing protein [Desulfofundulus salinum]RKO66372.1 hypothetical protein D7024_05055 [Desulfofundulus salinum]
MPKNKLVNVLTALVLVVLSGALVWYIIGITAPTVPVVKAQKKIPVGTIITGDMVKVQPMARVDVPPDAVSDVREVIGKTVTLGTLLPGDPVRKAHVKAGVGSLQARLNALAPGRVAVDLPAESGLKGLSAGDKVMVFGEVPVGDAASKTAATVVELIARDAVVLEVPGDRPQGEGVFGGTGGAKGPVVVAVTPEEAKKIANSIVRGKRTAIALLPREGVR